jgi:prepilin-type N-terminal cleavage/methylation domain-containing protein
MAVVLKACGQRSRRNGGFTLVELLVVITIIGILAGLVLAAVSGAFSTTGEAVIRTELTSLDSAFVQYGNDISGGSYPPNLSNAQMADGNGGATNMPNPVRARILSDFKRHLNAAFPQHREPDELLERICGSHANGSQRPDGLFGGMSPQEALVFWLGGFSDDNKYPISGPGGPSFLAGQAEDWAARKPLFDFKEERLGPRDAEGNFGGDTARQIAYRVNGQDRVINFWQYFPNNLKQAYAYLDTSRQPLDGLPLDSFPQLVPIKQRKSSVTDPSNLRVGDVRYANEGKCQLLSAGLDDEWGPFLQTQGVNFSNKTASAPLLLLYPDGPFTAELGDTITNFSTGASLEDSQP